jgi:hypothetical protein
MMLVPRQSCIWLQVCIFLHLVSCFPNGCEEYIDTEEPLMRALYNQWSTEQRLWRYSFYHRQILRELLYTAFWWRVCTIYTDNTDASILTY